MKIHMQNNLPAATQRAAEAVMKKLADQYGEDAVTLGVHIHNSAGAVFALVKHRISADVAEYIDLTLRGLIADLGTAYNVDPDVAMKVAAELRRMSLEMGQELAGDDEGQMAEVEAAAKEALARAARGELPN
jgi:hypothetical protein